MRPDRLLVRLLGLISLAGASSGVFWSGLFFLTSEVYQFSSMKNLVLGTFMGVASAIGARAATPLCAESTPRSVLAGSLGVWSLAASLPFLLLHVEWAVWVAGLLGAACSACVWSVAESYAGSGRSGPQLRSAVGAFTLSWMPATALPLLLPLHGAGGAERPAALLFAAVACALACAACVSLPLAPRHDVETTPEELHPEYTWLQRTAFRLLPVSYVISSTLAPVLPARFEEVGLGNIGAMGAAVWLLARFFSVLLMWRSGSWHGRWATLLLGGSALLFGLVSSLLADSGALLLFGLCVYGIGMGVTYYAALYYTMSVGRASVAAGSQFELVVGLAYAAGPILGLVAHAFGSADAHRRTVHLALLLALVAAPFVARPYWQSRHERRLST
jgi:hypothetical protein